MVMRHLRVLIAGALATLALTGCGGSSEPPTAVQLAREIPGCHHVTPARLNTIAKTEADCDPPGDDGIGWIQIDTFSTMAKEQQWIMEQEELVSYPAGSCCVEGQLWAADYLNLPNEFPRIIKALGGRRVRSHL
jgi:hypothetical protein